MSEQQYHKIGMKKDKVIRFYNYQGDFADSYFKNFWILFAIVASIILTRWKNDKCIWKQVIKKQLISFHFGLSINYYQMQIVFAQNLLTSGKD